MTATALRWLADQSGIAHAYRGAAPWALCGRPVTPEEER